ncbi:MAG: CBS domain-containing protein [Methylocystis sp.]|nr:CBS domain-containing protein [Methylocystis sp.]MBI3274782.1 CBS domain-containing protein [Methylocystis sp.]
MTVASILATKGRCVVTTRPNRTLQQASAELTLHKIGALVVVDANDDVVGVISERDVVAAIASRGSDALLDTVAQHMQTNLKIAAEDDTVDATMETMTVERRRHLPVLREGRLTGLVSIGDVVKYRIELIETEHQALRDYIATA